MAPALPPWPHPAGATETRARFGEETAATGTCACRVTSEPKPSNDQPCSLRLRSRLILSHGCRGVDGRYHGVTTDAVDRALDHRFEVADPAVLRSTHACAALIHALLAEAPATAGYDLGPDNWMDPSMGGRTPPDIAMEIVTYVREEIDGVVDMGCVAPGSLDIDVLLPQLRVTLFYSEPKALLLACKEAAAAKTDAPSTNRKRRRLSSELYAICMVDEDAGDVEETVTLRCSAAAAAKTQAAGAPTTSRKRRRESIEPCATSIVEEDAGDEEETVTLPCSVAAAKTEAVRAPATSGKRRRESSEPCAICMVDEDAGDEEETVALPCSHAFHSDCILTWFHRESTCPTCRCDIMEYFSFVRSSASTPPQQSTDDLVDEELEADLFYSLSRPANPADARHFIDSVTQEEEEEDVD